MDIIMTIGWALIWTWTAVMVFVILWGSCLMFIDPLVVRFRMWMFSRYTDRLLKETNEELG